MKVAIVYPEVYDLARFKEKRKEFPPFGILYLAAILEKNGIEIKLFKAFSRKTMFDFRDFDAVAFSIPSSATYNLIKKVRFNSIYSDNTMVMVGGVHPSFYPEQTLFDIKPHVVGIGPGEETILELVNEQRKRRFSKINGICYLEGSLSYKTPVRSLLQNVDILPFPARHLLKDNDVIMTDRLSNTNLRMAHIMFSRGCPFSCRFCAVFQKKLQYRSGESIKAELQSLIENYKIDGFAVVDDNFVINKTRVHGICNSIAELNLKWSALSRVDTVDYELLETMNESGCIEVKFGVESGSSKILKAMGKNITKAQIYNAIHIAHSIGIKVKVFIVHGYPGENLETTRETISLLKEIAPAVERISLFRFVPLPGSYVYKNAKEFRLLVSEEKSNWDKCHIHHNHFHWWGDASDFKILIKAYNELKYFIENTWPST